MTRWARTKSVYQHCKQPEESTPWADYVIGINKSEENRCNDDQINSISSTKVRSTKKKSVNKKQNLKSFKESSSKKRKKFGENENSEDETREHNSRLKNKGIIRKKKLNVKGKQSKILSNDLSKPNETFLKYEKNLKNDVDQQCQIMNPDNELIEKKKLQKKNKLQKMKELRKMKRQQNGITLLPEKIENKIYRLKSNLRKKGMSGEIIKEIVRKERRKEETKYKKETNKNKKVCFHCREPGHHIANCPLLSNDVEQGTDICFKCGSTEHKVDGCSSKINDFPFAKCFICGKQGHLSRNCPNNKKGLYPYGGCCKQCGKTDHLKKNCPELQKSKGISEMLLPTMKTNISADADVDEYFEEGKKNQNKVIKF